MTKSAQVTIVEDSSGAAFRAPRLEDGAEVWKLIKQTGVLDLNSSYSYLMWCTYFNDTSIIIEADEKIVGFVSGFVKPDAPNTLFIWQVAVAESERGKGFAAKMLHHLLKRDSCEGIKYIETTISPSNIASQRLFQGLARDLETEIAVSELFGVDDFPEKGHEDELMHHIGPF